MFKTGQGHFQGSGSKRTECVFEPVFISLDMISSEALRSCFSTDRKRLTEADYGLVPLLKGTISWVFFERHLSD